MRQWLHSLLFGCFILGATAAQAADAMATRTLHLRSGPGTRHAIRTAIPAGHSVHVSACSKTWCQVHYRGHTGWASAQYLAFKHGKGGKSMLPSRPPAGHPAYQGNDPRRNPYQAPSSHDAWWRDYWRGKQQKAPSHSGWWRPSNWWHRN